MKKITLTLAAFALVFTAFAQDVVIERLGDTTTGLISTNGENDQGVYCADYFVLEEDTILGSITLDGFTSTFANFEDDNLLGADIFIYADGGGFPEGNPTEDEGILVLRNIPVGDGFETIIDENDVDGQIHQVNFTAANGGAQVVLPAGEYWVSYAPVVLGDSADNAGNRWNWIGSTTVVDNDAVLIDSGDLFASGFTDWTAISAIIAADFPSFGWTLTSEEESAGLGDNDLVGASVYPNPATNVINVDFSSNVELKSAVLFDVLGKNTGATLVNGSMNIADLAAGVYILNIETNNGSLTQKVIKQ